MSAIRIAVVGAGIMGSNHARVIARLPGAEVAAVVDSDRGRGEVLAAAHGVRWAGDLGTVARHVDAVVVACPNAFHADVAVQSIEAGLAVLVEKPIAETLADADRIVTAADRAGVLAMVGHIERFNPVVIELAELLGSAEHLEIDRVGPFTPRIASGVVNDLMIHDLDLCWHLLGEEPVEIRAIGRNPRSSTEDLAVVLLRFPSGVTATLTASRLGQSKVRQITATLTDQTIAADLIRNDLTISRIEHVEYSNEGGARYRQSGIVEIPYIQNRGEPLALELAHFVQCVQDGSTPSVSLVDGRRALALAQRITALIEPELTVHSPRTSA